jgi:transposase
MRAQPHRRVFLEETGTTTKMPREYGRSLRGQRLKGTAPFRRWGNQTLIAVLSCDGIVAPWVISGAMDRDAFDTDVEKVLIPELDPGSVVILDDLATHKNDAAAQMLKSHGCWVLFLPAYSPDLNPIEMAFSKLIEPPRVCRRWIGSNVRLLFPRHSRSQKILLCSLRRDVSDFAV